MKINRKHFEKHIIAQHDDEDYSESGYAVTVDGDHAGIFWYSHCSCYGTWGAISGNDDYSWDNTPPPDRDVKPVWEGTVAELVSLASRKADPAMPERAAMEEDSDYDHLMNVYGQVLAWHQSRSKQ